MKIEPNIYVKRLGVCAAFAWCAGVGFISTGCKSTSISTHQTTVVCGGVIRAQPKIAFSEDETALVQAAAKPAAAFDGAGWKSLFDGRTLKGWQMSDFGGSGPTGCESGLIVIEPGDALSGINYTNGGLPKVNYEIALDAMKLQGSDFFCGLTFPVRDSFCSLILGGWGGAVTGLSSIDEEDASENETAKFLRYDLNRWYRVRVKVTDAKIEAWVDDQKIVDFVSEGRKIGLRFGEIENSKPLGIATYQTRSAIREIKVRTLDAGSK